MISNPQAADANNDKPKLCLLTNIIAPSRLSMLRRLAEVFELVVLHGGMESNRDWPLLTVEKAYVKRVNGWQVRRNRYVDGQIYDSWFVHIEPEYLIELIRQKPAAIITSEMGVRSAIALLYGALFRKPVWIWWGGTQHTERRLGKLRRLLRKIFAKVVRQWITYGMTSTEYLESLGVRRARITQIQNCVDETKFLKPFIPEFEITPRPVVLHVGQLIARKGIEAFLRAAARVQKEGSEFSVLFVGEGRDRHKLQLMVEDLGIHNVHFKGSVSPDRLRGVYGSADVLIFPTLEDVWGLVANEAILSGLPVLCSKYAGCAKELFDEANIFDPNDPDGFVAALRRAVRGELPPCDRSRLKRDVEVADIVADSILGALHSGVKQRETIQVSTQSTCLSRRLATPHPTYVTTSWDDGGLLDCRLAELLAKYGLSGTFYVPLENPERPVIGRESIRELGRNFEIGGHTVSHCDLTKVNPATARREISDCKVRLEDITGKECVSFCFPKGRYRRDHLDYAREAGFKVARTAELLSTDYPRSYGQLSVLATTIQAYPHSVPGYIRNALKRGKPGKVLYYLNHRGSDWAKTAEQLLTDVLSRGGVFHLWGHSWEIEEYDQWGQLERLFSLIAELDTGAARLSNAKVAERLPQ